MKIHHKPVLLQYILEHFIEENSTVFDGTLGEGGHSIAFLKKNAKVYACDRDKSILKKAEQRIGHHPSFHSFNHHFKDILTFIPAHVYFDFILFDLGVSVYHYKESKRGFSFFEDEILDMRVDKKMKKNAFDIIQNYSENELANIFYHYSQETYAKKIAREIILRREIKPIKTALDLANIIESIKGKRKIHSATKVFQALRIAVNEELEHIEQTIDNSLDLLKKNGKLAIITYHSLEDVIIKNKFKKIVGKKLNLNKYKDEIINVSEYEIFNKKIITPNIEEIMDNPSARSAKMRVLLKKDMEIENAIKKK